MIIEGLPTPPLARDQAHATHHPVKDCFGEVHYPTGTACTFSGQPATITKDTKKFCRVRPLNPERGDGAQYTWSTAQRIMDEHGGAFGDTQPS